MAYKLQYLITMKRTLMILVSILLTGCSTYTDTEETESAETAKLTSPLSDTALETLYAVMAAWEVVYGNTVSDGCTDRLELDTTVSAIDPAAEGWPINTWGHAWAGPWAIDAVIKYNQFLVGDDLVGVLIHEWIHLLGNCQRGDPDNEHINPKMFTCVDSVEKEAQRIMGVEFTSAYVCAK